MRTPSSQVPMRFLVIAAVIVTFHRPVDRSSPKPGADYAALCEFMLDLSGLDVKKT